MAAKLTLIIFLKSLQQPSLQSQQNLNKLAASSGGGFESLHSFGVSSGMFIYKRLITLNYRLM